jgi:hypothetical protein
VTWPVIVNLVLSEGIAAVALAVVALMAARAARRAGARRAGLAVAVFGVAAAAVSWAQFVLAAWLQFGPVASGHAAAAGTLWSVVSGFAFVLLANALSGAVYVAGVLLLAVVTATGVTLRTSR